MLVPCRPPFWAKNGHIQTIAGHVLKSPILKDVGIESSPIVIKLFDGDQLHGRWIPSGNSKRVTYLFHGLGGSADSDYIQRAAIQFAKRGDQVVMINHRGCGEGAGFAKSPYHSGSAHDLGRWIAWGKTKFPEMNHLAIGVSLSGNALALLLGCEDLPIQTRDPIALPDAAIIVNAPIDLKDSALNLMKGWNRIYDLRFVERGKKSVRQKGEALTLPFGSTLFDFDEAYTAKAAGFRNREDYYRRCSSKQFISEIKTPSIFLTSEDDPFVDFRHYANLGSNPNVTVHIEKFGGHVGYLNGPLTPLGNRRWLDYALDHFAEKFPKTKNS